MVQLFGHRVRDSPTERALREHDVRIGEEQPFAARALRTAPERMVLAEPSRGQLIDADRADPRVARGELCQDRTGRVA